MADVTDVQNALAGVIAAAVYPDGTGQPSVTGLPTRIYPGWPMSAKLDQDLLAGIVNISIFGSKTERNTTRYPRELQELSRLPHTIGATVTNITVTLTGTVATPQYVTLVVDNVPYSYPVQSGDTLAAVATGLATLVAVDRTAVSSGATVVIAGSHRIKVNIGRPGTLGRELRRQNRMFGISVWANSPDSRSVTAKLVDGKLTGMDWIALPDLTAGRMIYGQSGDVDEPQKALEYRRDLAYWIEYPTIDTLVAYEVTVLDTYAPFGTVPHTIPHRIVVAV